MKGEERGGRIFVLCPRKKKSKVGAYAPHPPSGSVPVLVHKRLS